MDGMNGSFFQRLQFYAKSSNCRVRVVKITIGTFSGTLEWADEAVVLLPSASP
jgi:hypothetical protein